jgi:hypothetical protein
LAAIIEKYPYHRHWYEFYYTGFVNNKMMGLSSEKGKGNGCFHAAGIIFLVMIVHALCQLSL